MERAGAILVLTPASETLLIPRRDREQEKWTGPKLAPEGTNARAATGFDTVLASEEFESRLFGWAGQGKKIYTLHGNPKAESLKLTLLPLREIADAELPIARLRMKKSGAELALIQRATDASIDAHFAAWRMIRPGVTEYKVAAVMGGHVFREGCERNAYSPIVGGGPERGHAPLFRESEDDRPRPACPDGRGCRMLDVRERHYTHGAGNRQITARQRELYEIVLGAQNAVIDAIKPGMSLARTGPASLNKVARDYFDSHGKDKHGEPLEVFYPWHWPSSGIGRTRRERSGAAAGREYGDYGGTGFVYSGGRHWHPDEDLIQVTDSGAKILTSRLPRDPDEIEKFFASR